MHLLKYIQVCTKSVKIDQRLPKRSSQNSVSHSSYTKTKKVSRLPIVLCANSRVQTTLELELPLLLLSLLFFPISNTTTTTTTTTTVPLYRYTTVPVPLPQRRRRLLLLQNASKYGPAFLTTSPYSIQVVLTSVSMLPCLVCTEI